MGYSEYLPERTPFKLPVRLDSAAPDLAAVASAALDLASEVPVLIAAISHSNFPYGLPGHTVVAARA